jgi:hypothetical protein
MSNIFKVALPYVFGSIVAAAAFLTGAVTDYGQALGIALSKEKAAEYCAQFVDPVVPSE